MPNLVVPLQPDAAYMYCPRCRNAGTVNSPLRRQSHLFVCNFGHQYDSWSQLQRESAEMTPMSAVMQEAPNPLAIKWPIFVMPETREALELKFAGRIHTTLGTFLDLLADDQIIFIQASEASELKKRGLHNGTSIIAALDSYKDLERERETAVKRLEQLLATLRTSGVEG